MEKSLINTEAFSNILLETFLTNLLSLTCPSLQILGNFWSISCKNSITSNDIDMKFGQVTQHDKRNKKVSKIFWLWPHISKLWRHWHFSGLLQFGAIQRPDSGRIVCKTYISINSNVLSYKKWKKINTALVLLLWVKVPFLPKNAIFLQINADISKN